MLNTPFARNVLGLGKGAPAPAPPIDFSQAHLVNARDVFRERPSERPKSLAEKLTNARVQMHRSGAAPEEIRRADLLIVELGTLEERVEAFLSENQTRHISELTKRREAMREKCRHAENDARTTALEAGRLSGRLNFASQMLSEARAKCTEAASNPTFDSRFPSALEIAEWNAKRSAVEKELRDAQAQYSEIQQDLRTAQADQSSTSKKLRECVEELDTIDRELSAAEK